MNIKEKEQSKTVISQFSFYKFSIQNCSHKTKFSIDQNNLARGKFISPKSKLNACFRSFRGIFQFVWEQDGDTNIIRMSETF